MPFLVSVTWKVHNPFAPVMKMMLDILGTISARRRLLLAFHVLFFRHNELLIVHWPFEQSDFEAVYLYFYAHYAVPISGLLFKWDFRSGHHPNSNHWKQQMSFPTASSTPRHATLFLMIPFRCTVVIYYYFLLSGFIEFRCSTHAGHRLTAKTIISGVAGKG